MLREESGKVKVLGVNESANSIIFDMEYGYVSFDGKIRRTLMTRIELPTFTRDFVLEFDKGTYDFTEGACFVKPENSGIHPAILRTNDFRDLDIRRSEIKISEVENKDGKISFMVSSDVYAHAVYFDLNDDIRPSDEYFDLLPGEHRRIELQNAEKLRVEDIKPLSIINAIL